MTEQAALLDLTADIVSAFVGNNSAHAADLPEIIKTVHSALTNISAPKQEVAQGEVLTPAVPIKKSVADDFITCLEDGKKFKSLKRHLQTAYGMTPDEYRTKWSLPRSYPMVAPGYAATRSELARAAGLGRKPAAAAAAEEPAPAPAPAPARAPEPEEAAPAPAKRRGRAASKVAA